MVHHKADGTLLVDACTAWQGGRDGGSSPIRAAARVLTQTKHYFESDFIAEYERDASASQTTMTHARTLLDALAVAPVRDAAGWGRSTGTDSAWVGRGIKTAPQDAEITTALRSGSISMPLWGLSLDREVALSFGNAFLFELIGPFPAIAAWTASLIKDDERELIAGGRYSVIGMDERAGGYDVKLEFIEALQPAV